VPGNLNDEVYCENRGSDISDQPVSLPHAVLAGDPPIGGITDGYTGIKYLSSPLSTCRGYDSCWEMRAKIVREMKLLDSLSTMRISDPFWRQVWIPLKT